MLHDKQIFQQKKQYFQQTLANQLVTAVIILDQNLTIVYANPAAEALLVKSFSKLYGLSFNSVFITSF